MGREKRDIKPLLLKFGMALALSFAGFLYSRLRTRRIKPSPPPAPGSPDHSSGFNLEGEIAQHKDDIPAVKTSSSSSNLLSVAAEKYEETHRPKVSFDTMIGVSPSSRSSADKDGFLLPEFNDIVKQLDFDAANAGISPKKDVETPSSNTETPKVFRSAEKDEYEEEIRHLRNMVRMLQERERNLEVQLLEYYGLKEQETAVMELQNRLKINNMEAKLFTLKIESLQAENQRLEARVADHVKVLSELEAARAKIRMLKKKLRFEAEQNREHILALQQRVAKLQDQEYKAAPNDLNTKLNMQRLKELEVEAEELRKSNMRLQIENSELSRSLESTQILANSVSEDPEVEALRVEREHLRCKNEDLEKEIERLEEDRYSDAEELVYLKWINACLRYELRNYQPSDAKTVARDLSKTLSPKSEEKAKQLILEYANTEGMGEKRVNIMEFYYGEWSSSQASAITDSGEIDVSSVVTSATKTNSPSKNNFFSKLRNIIHGKDNDDNRILSAHRTGSFEDSDSPWCSSGISSGMYARNEGHSNRFSTTMGSVRNSLDLPGLHASASSSKKEHLKDIDSVQRNSDVGSHSGYKRFVLGREGADLALRSRLDQDSDSPEKSELVKYAEVLKESHAGKPTGPRR
ncbi:Protein CHUP1, chloroplastic [Morella rubra]|uniref:Protein CHUP1, chloroplastic n=1 Tax=Morella rubra TaxID=262757 RepID=A0A6A1VZU1_9ROSI|nr:Protein CHUP1, chloroplastic [Morella rubra]